MSELVGVSALRWIRATWFGWLLGIPAVAVLALLGELLGLGGAQGWVGAGMGIGVGVLQARALRPVGVGMTPWVTATALGLAAPFLAIDLIRLLGGHVPYYLLICVAVGGWTVGALQARLLAGPRGRWVVASAFGWLLAAVAAWSADALFRSHRVAGVIGALEYLGLLACGGGLLGFVTAPTIRQMHGPA
ncbi:MAG TPA: hypothetical protein VJN95_05950 [Gemmatimonadales bacterium]|nr:hypothetical protein [Gemmatimonadales bacterium]